MAEDDQRWDDLVAAVPTISVKNKQLYRAVAQLSFDKSRRYLFTSGKRNRCNPAGIFCIYMADDRNTALTEYDKYYTDLGNVEPCVIYTGRLTSAAIIDLEDPDIRDHFGLTDADFFTAFRTKPAETPLEKLGRGIARQTKITAIRYPSDAMHARSRDGYNIAVFKEAVKHPDRLQIIGPNDNVLEDWPGSAT
jgi:RES domain-containing protein